MTEKYQGNKNKSVIHIHDTLEPVTKILTKVASDTSIGYDGIGLITHLMSYSNKEENFTYKSVLGDAFSIRKTTTAWDKCERAGYILAFRKYTSNDNEYQYHFDQNKFATLSLKVLFEELYADGFVYYSKILYKKENRTLLNIKNSLPMFLDDEEREELAQWIFDRILFPQAPQAEEEAERVQKAYQRADEAITVPEIKETDSDPDKLRKQRNIIQQDYPEYKPLFAKLKDVTRSINVNEFELNHAVITCIDKLKDYLLYTNPTTSHGVVEEPLVWEIVNKQIERNATQLENISQYLNYFKNGLDNLTSLKFAELDSQDPASEPLSDDYFNAVDTLLKDWGYEK